MRVLRSNCALSTDSFPIGKSQASPSKDKPSGITVPLDLVRGGIARQNFIQENIDFAQENRSSTLSFSSSRKNFVAGTSLRPCVSGAAGSIGRQSGCTGVMMTLSRHVDALEGEIVAGNAECTLRVSPSGARRTRPRRFSACAANERQRNLDGRRLDAGGDTIPSPTGGPAIV
jgi:hypothetical protein